jgi:hypothetical protein
MIFDVDETSTQPTSIYKQGLVRLSLGGGCSYEKDEACDGHGLFQRVARAV